MCCNIVFLFPSFLVLNVEKDVTLNIDLKLAVLMNAISSGLPQKDETSKTNMKCKMYADFLVP